VNLFEVTGGSVKIFKSVLALSVLLTMLVACGDDSSSSVSPDSGASISDGNELSSSNKDGSSSSQKDSKKSSSSVAEKNSSSSVSGKNSSSSVVESSSSEEEFRVCDDGDTLSSDEASGVYYYICKDGWWALDHVLDRDSLDSLAAIEKKKEHPNMDSLFAGYNGEYLEFEDPRDGRKYKYIKFEGHSEDFDAFETFYVMAENLNYGKMVPSSTTKFDDNVTEKLCYVDDEWFCDNHFGGLYSWAEAMNLPKVCDSVAVDSNEACKAITEKRGSYPGEEYLNIIWQGICPDGWHVMNQLEWRFTRGDLRSKILWEKNAGRNTDGLAVIPTEKIQTGQFTAFWMPYAVKNNVAKAAYFSSTSRLEDLSGDDVTRRTFRSVRCVMDANNSLTGK
jgi:uncharacterized protein (TIGR02145 family)